MGLSGILELAALGQRVDGVKVLVAALPGLTASFIHAIQQRPIGFVHFAVAGHKRAGKP